VLFEDECHLMEGDLSGYVWGRTGERVEIPIENSRNRQTYYGVLNLLTKRVLVQAQDKGNTDCMIAFLKYLQEQMPGKRFLIFWDGASYHRSHQLREYLALLNDGLPPDKWLIQVVRFAANDPSQNPIEDVWLQAKTWLRRMSGLCPSFHALKALFTQFFSFDIFDFPKLNLYGSFS
jgi:transposase